MPRPQFNNPYLRRANDSHVVRGICPGCEARTNFIAPSYYGADGQLVDLIDTDQHDTEIAAAGLRICPDRQCGSVVFFWGNLSKDLEIYPSPKMNFRVQHVPQQIREDAEEALRCNSVSAWKATITMCRRVVQSTCIDKNASGSDLKTQIENLKKAGTIDDTLEQWAHQIRFFGNFGAHPDPAFGSITKDDATVMIEFMELFLVRVYEMPEKINQARTRSGKP
jgi:hypothetical protein